MQYIKPLWLVLAIFPSICMGWGSEGHHIVGVIATAYLTAHSKQEIVSLLENDLDAKGQPSGRKTLAEVSTWADEIRGSARRTAPWHYDNVPISPLSQRK